MNRYAYAAHRWLGLVVGAQLLAWSLGGLMFALLDIDEVHGDVDRVQRPAAVVASDVVPVAAVLAQAPAATSALLVERRGRLVWVLALEGRTALFDARTGAPVPAVDAEEAKRIALADTSNARSVTSAELFSDDPPIEYRGKPLPAWCVVLDHDSGVHVYIDAVTGEVRARRLPSEEFPCAANSSFFPLPPAPSWLARRRTTGRHRTPDKEASRAAEVHPAGMDMDAKQQPYDLRFIDTMSEHHQMAVDMSKMAASQARLVATGPEQVGDRAQRLTGPRAARASSRSSPARRRV